jgi:hypothetical protein
MNKHINIRALLIQYGCQKAENLMQISKPLKKLNISSTNFIANF